MTVLLVEAGWHRTALAVSAARSDVKYVPASAHAAGVNVANWRTDVEVHNPGTTLATFTVDLLKQTTDSGGRVPSRIFSPGPQASTSYVDILVSIFGLESAAALRFTTTSSSILVTSRSYNLVGANNLELSVEASFGQFVRGLAAQEGIADGVAIPQPKRGDVIEQYDQHEFRCSTAYLPLHRT